jgi:hypothetical protein
VDSTFYLRLWGLMQGYECGRPVATCLCTQALLFVWPAGKTIHWELRTKGGKREEGGAPNEEEAKRFAATALVDLGLQRVRLVWGRPVEVPCG